MKKDIDTSQNQDIESFAEYYSKYDTIVRRLKAYGLNCLRVDEFDENEEPYDESEAITFDHDFDDHSCFQDIIDDLIAVFDKYKMKEQNGMLKLMNVQKSGSSKEGKS